MKKMLFFVLLLFSCNAFCLSTFWLGAGTTTRNVGSAQNELSGDTVTFGFNPTLIVGTTLPFFFPGIYLSPGIGYAKYLSNNKDNTSRNEIILQYHLAQEIIPAFYLRYGFSNTITKIGGDGGTVSLKNGDSTSTFYVPEETKTSFMGSLDLGFEMLLESTFGARLQLSVDRFLSSERRRLSHLLTMNYYF